jgi:hypothetical protein
MAKFKSFLDQFNLFKVATGFNDPISAALGGDPLGGEALEEGRAQSKALKQTRIRIAEQRRQRLLS